MTPAGFPHSDIPGSTHVCCSPRLIAAYHVLLRLLVPRHPPCALSSLTGHPSVLALHLPVSRIRLSKSSPRQRVAEITSVIHHQVIIHSFEPTSTLPAPKRGESAWTQISIPDVWWR